MFESIDMLSETSTSTLRLFLIRKMMPPAIRVMRKIITMIMEMSSMVLFWACELVLSTLYAKRMRGGKGDVLYVALPLMLTVPNLLVNPMLQDGAAARIVII